MLQAAIANHPDAIPPASPPLLNTIAPANRLVRAHSTPLPHAQSPPPPPCTHTVNNFGDTHICTTSTATTTLTTVTPSSTPNTSASASSASSAPSNSCSNLDHNSLNNLNNSQFNPNNTNNTGTLPAANPPNSNPNSNLNINNNNNNNSSNNNNNNNSNNNNNNSNSSGASKKRVKIPVPADRFPDFNFVGRLLGPRGTTLKTLARDTGCKIMIRGKGSIRKDKEPDVRHKPGYEHVFTEPLHVVVEAADMPDDASATRALHRAKEAVELLLVPVPEERDGLKRQQLRALAIMNGTYRGGPSRSFDGLATPTFDIPSSNSNNHTPSTTSNLTANNGSASSSTIGGNNGSSTNASAAINGGSNPNCTTNDDGSTTGLHSNLIPFNGVSAGLLQHDPYSFTHSNNNNSNKNKSHNSSNCHVDMSNHARPRDKHALSHSHYHMHHHHINLQHGHTHSSVNSHMSRLTSIPNAVDRQPEQTGQGGQQQQPGPMVQHTLSYDLLKSDLGPGLRRHHSQPIHRVQHGSVNAPSPHDKPVVMEVKRATLQGMSMDDLTSSVDDTPESSPSSDDGTSEQHGKHGSGGAGGAAPNMRVGMGMFMGSEFYNGAFCNDGAGGWDSQRWDGQAVASSAALSSGAFEVTTPSGDERKS